MVVAAALIQSGLALVVAIDAGLTPVVLSLPRLPSRDANHLVSAVFAVGDAGQVLAVDSAGPEYGGPVSIGEAHDFTNASPLGERIQYQLSTDLLSSEWGHPENAFDLVVFSHSSWYMSTPEAVQEMFGRVRPWAKQFVLCSFSARTE